MCQTLHNKTPFKHIPATVISHAMKRFVKIVSGMDGEALTGGRHFEESGDSVSFFFDACYFMEKAHSLCLKPQGLLLYKLACTTSFHI